jgi:hypothetical protein
MNGCLPTSVVIQPASMATIAATPDTATARRNHGVSGIRRRRHHDHASHSASSSRAVPIPIIVL